MPTRVSRLDDARHRAQAGLGHVGRELRLARRAAGLSQQAVADAAHLPRSKVSRVERVGDPGLSLADASVLLAAVGLDLSVRAFPGGDPARDAAHTALLERLRVRLHPSLGWATEVPLPLAGDRRAWDALISGESWRIGVEAETHAEDRQALERKVMLKMRDGGVAAVLVVLARTEANRRFAEQYEAELRRAFPVGAREALRALAAGLPLRANALALL